MPKRNRKFLPIITGGNAVSKLISESIKIGKQSNANKSAMGRISKLETKYRPKKGKTKTKATISSVGGTIVSIPQAVGEVFGPSSFKISSEGVGPADVSSHNALRITGHGCSTIRIGVNSTDAKVLVVGGTPEWTHGLHPNEIDYRLATFASLYRSYVIRRLDVHYMSACPTSTADGYTIGLAESMGEASAFVTGPSCIAAMGFETSLSGPFWQNATCSYVNPKGSKTFVPLAGGTANDDNTQLTLCGIASLEAKASGNANYGRIMTSYVVDFYRPTIANGSVTLAAQGKDHEDLPVDQSKEKSTEFAVSQSHQAGVPGVSRPPRSEQRPSSPTPSLLEEFQILRKKTKAVAIEPPSPVKKQVGKDQKSCSVA